MSDLLNVSICGDKYRIIQRDSGVTVILRYGEEWRNATGDKVILGAAFEIEELRTKLQRLLSFSESMVDAATSIQDWSGTHMGDLIEEFEKLKSHLK